MPRKSRKGTARRGYSKRKPSKRAYSKKRKTYKRGQRKRMSSARNLSIPRTLDVGTQHPAEITYRIPFNDHMTVYPSAVDSNGWPYEVLPTSYPKSLGGALKTIWANCPDHVWTMPGSYSYTDMGSWIHDGLSTVDDQGQNTMVFVPSSYYNSCIVTKAEITVTFTPTTTHLEADNGWAFNPEALCFLNFNSNPNTFNTGGSTAANLATPYQIKNSRYTRLGSTQLSAGAKPTSCTLKGTYNPHLLYHFKDMGDDPNFDIGINLPLSNPPEFPTNPCFWTLGIMSANPVPSSSAGADAVAGVPLVHRVDVKVVYTVKYFDAKTNLNYENIPIGPPQ